MKIPVSRPYIGRVEAEAVMAVLQSGQITQGPVVRKFENALGDYLGSPAVLATTSGTTALHLALLALGIGPGDEVIVPDITFVATANAVTYCGAVAVPADVNVNGWGISWEAAERKITKRTKAIIAVHLYGVPCDLDALSFLCSSNNLYLVEDAAEGLGGTYSGKKLGTVGDVGAFSFYGNKIITTGEGGAVVTASTAIRDRIYFLRGQAMDSTRRYYHPEVGYNYRMTEMQAAMGVAQLSQIDEFLLDRKRVLDYYRVHLSDHGYCPAWFDTESAPWMCTVYFGSAENRDNIATALAAADIETRPVFVPLHRLPMYSHGYDLDDEFVSASHIADSSLSLPTYVGMTEHDLERVVSVVKSVKGI